jgi:hypothetical protein
MGLLVECPECKKRNSAKVKACKCGFALAKFSGRVYWIDYLVEGQRRRERIGPNKESADQRLKEVLTARTEGRYIQKSPDVRTLFKDLSAWYLELPEVKAKRSYDRDQQSLNRLLLFFGGSAAKGYYPGPCGSLPATAIRGTIRARPLRPHKARIGKPGVGRFQNHLCQSDKERQGGKELGPRGEAAERK